MSTVILRNVNPLGHVDVPILGRVGDADDQPGEGCLIPLEEFECDADLAEELLKQVGNYELVDDNPLAHMTVPELKDHAAKQDPPIDLAGKTKKADILRAIKAAS
jgi:hypothetical protein